MQQRDLAINHGLLLQRYPDIRRITTQRFTEESGRRDPDHGEGLALHNEGGTHHGSVTSIDGLPRAMAEDRNRWSGGLVVVGNKHSPTEGFDTERAEIIAGDILGTQRPAGHVNTLSSNA